MANYRDMIDSFGLSSLFKLPDIPDYHLMVGSAEDHSPQPVTFFAEKTVPTQLVQGWGKYSDMDNSEIQEMIADGTIEVNDINWNVAMIGG